MYQIHAQQQQQQQLRRDTRLLEVKVRAQPEVSSALHTALKEVCAVSSNCADVTPARFTTTWITFSSPSVGAAVGDDVGEVAEPVPVPVRRPNWMGAPESSHLQPLQSQPYSAAAASHVIDHDDTQKSHCGHSMSTGCPPAWTTHRLAEARGGAGAAVGTDAGGQGDEE